LLDAGADPLAKGSSGRPEAPIIAASKSGSPEIVQILLEAGADPVARDNEPLRLAAASGNAAIVRLLLEKGAPASGTDNWPLRAASSSAFGEIVELLLEAGADPRVPEGKPLRKVFEKSPRIVNPGRIRVAATLIERGASMKDMPAKEREAAVLRAVKQGSAKDVAVILDDAAPDFGTDINGLLAIASLDEDSPDVARLLIERGADPKAIKEEFQERLRALLGENSA
jgi:ankyrin repeat protein